MVKFSIFGGLILFICAVNVKSFARPVERRDLGFGFPDDEDSPTKSVLINFIFIALFYFF